MSFRNARRQMSGQVARSERNQIKLQKLRDRVRQSTNAFMTRQHARLAWWQSAFRTPTLVSRFVSGFTSMWMMFLGLLGLSLRTSAANRRGMISFGSGSKRAKRRLGKAGKIVMRGLMCEPLEDRKLMAVVADNNFAALFNPAVVSPPPTVRLNG